MYEILSNYFPPKSAQSNKSSALNLPVEDWWKATLPLRHLPMIHVFIYFIRHIMNLNEFKIFTCPGCGRKLPVSVAKMGMAPGSTYVHADNSLQYTLLFIFI